MADLLRRLEPLGLQAIPSCLGGSVDTGAYLTTGGKGWEDVCGLLKGPGRLGDWRGTVHVLISDDTPATDPLVPNRRCSFRAGRFFFYGDPDLLDRMEQSLRGPPRAH
jgi:hypothetical protein